LNKFHSYAPGSSTRLEINRSGRCNVPALEQVESSGCPVLHAEIELGICVTGKGNVIMAHRSAEANPKVKLRWDFG
jgi:hypothetical protein